MSGARTNRKPLHASSKDQNNVNATQRQTEPKRTNKPTTPHKPRLPISSFLLVPRSSRSYSTRQHDNLNPSTCFICRSLPPQRCRRGTHPARSRRECHARVPTLQQHACQQTSMHNAAVVCLCRTHTPATLHQPELPAARTHHAK